MGSGDIKTGSSFSSSVVRKATKGADVRKNPIPEGGFKIMRMIG